MLPTALQLLNREVHHKQERLEWTTHWNNLRTDDRIQLCTIKYVGETYKHF